MNGIVKLSMAKLYFNIFIAIKSQNCHIHYTPDFGDLGLLICSWRSDEFDFVTHLH